MVPDVACRMQSLQLQFQWSTRAVEHRTYHVEESAVDSFCNTVRLWRVCCCDIVFNTERFDIFRHLVHIFCSPISAKFLDLVSALLFCPCLIFLDCCKDCCRELVGSNVDPAMSGQVICNGQ